MRSVPGILGTASFQQAFRPEKTLLELDPAMAPPFTGQTMQGGRPAAMRILLVEDSRQLSDWLAKTLRRENYVIDCVYDGEDADHALQTQEYALVILDLSLPKI